MELAACSLIFVGTFATACNRCEFYCMIARAQSVRPNACRWLVCSCVAQDCRDKSFADWCRIGLMNLGMLDWCWRFSPMTAASPTVSNAFGAATRCLSSLLTRRLSLGIATRDVETSPKAALVLTRTDRISCSALSRQAPVPWTYPRTCIG